MICIVSGTALNSTAHLCQGNLV